jgi:hypothetical protein
MCEHRQQTTVGLHTDAEGTELASRRCEDLERQPLLLPCTSDDALPDLVQQLIELQAYRFRHRIGLPLGNRTARIRVRCHE